MLECYYFYHWNALQWTRPRKCLKWTSLVPNDWSKLNYQAWKSGRMDWFNSSYAGVVGNPFLDLYCATKFAIEGLTESIAPSLLHLISGKSTLTVSQGYYAVWFCLLPDTFGRVMASKANVPFISIKHVYKITNQSQKRKALIGKVAGEIKKLLKNTFKTFCNRKSAIKGRNQ